MRFEVLLFVAVMQSVGSLAQVLSTKSRVAELKQSGAQYVLTFYEFQSESSYTLIDNRVLGPSTYFLWKDSTGAWIQKMSYYLDAGNVVDTLFKVVRFDQVEVFEYLTNHFEAIKTQELRSGLIKFKTNRGDSLAKVFRKEDQVVIIECFANQDAIKKVFRRSQLDKGITLNEDGSVRDQRESVNYHFNTSMELYKLYILLHAAIVQFESRIILAGLQKPFKISTGVRVLMESGYSVELGRGGMQISSGLQQ